MPKISVIVPVYNSEKYLHRCIDSILAQTFTDFELLLIDDGSKDNSSAICDEYAAKDSRVRVFHKENGGVSSARNMGLDNAQGEWIAFCDSDDYVEEVWLELYTNNSTGVDMVVQGYYNAIPLKEKNFVYEGDIHPAVKMLFNAKTLGFLHTKMFLHNIIKEKNIRFCNEIKFREDEDFVLMFFSNIKNIRCIKEGGYNYIIPDLAKKYLGHDNFEVSLSLFVSANRIYCGESNFVTAAYLHELINAYFYSFNYKNVNYHERTRELNSAIGNAIFKVNYLSIISRIILYFFPAYLASKIFKIKTIISK